MMFLHRDKINYLCKKYNLKVCRLGDTYKLFIQSSIFPPNSYWYVFIEEKLTDWGWDWILEFDSKSIENEYQYIKITDTQSLAVIDKKNSAICGKVKYQLITGLKLNYNTQEKLVDWIESFINDIKKLEKTLEVESKIKNLEKDFV